MKVEQALIVVDIQKDFLPGGALSVEDGDQVLAPVSELIRGFALVVASGDWHPPNHKSFASQHEGQKAGDVIDLNGMEQVLWPDHCVQNSEGAQFADTLPMQKINEIFFKGTDPEVDSYSAFFDNGRRRTTGLRGYLQEHGVEELHVVGLATDYCVKATALDAVREGFRTVVHVNACRGVNLRSGDADAALAEMKQAGVKIV